MNENMHFIWNYDFNETTYLQDLTNFDSEWNKFLEILVIKVVQGSCVFRVGNKPIDGGEMFTLGQFLVQTPEHLHNT